MTKLAIIQMTPWDAAGFLPRVLNDLKLEQWSVYRPYLGQKFNNFANYDAFTLLGGHHSANKLPSDLIWCFDLVEKALVSNKAIIGHCLGGQVIAKALGARVIKCEHEEIGWHKLTSHLKDGWPASITAFQWHSEGFEIPRNATRLYTGELWDNQAFTYMSAFAMQFHLEVNEPLIINWYRRNQLIQPYKKEYTQKKLVGQYINLFNFYKRWLKHD